MNKNSTLIPSIMNGIQGSKEDLDALRLNLIENKKLLIRLNYWGTDNLITFGKNLSFLEDELLLELIFKYAKHEYDKAIIWRTHILTWVAKTVSNLPGDFVECGVHMGFTMAVISDYINIAKLNKLYWGYDLFDGDHYKSFDMNGMSPFEYVSSQFDNTHTKIIKGAIEDSMIKNAPDKVAFLHIDLNSAIAEEAALKHFFPKLTRGGIIVLDDYGWSNYKEQKQMADNFFNENKLSVVELPTGQGIVIVN